MPTKEEEALAKEAKAKAKADAKAVKEAEKARVRAAKAEGITPESEDTAPELSVKSLPTFENAQVVEVLEENVISGRFHHCKMSDGTTKHVPVELF